MGHFRWVIVRRFSWSARIAVPVLCGIGSRLAAMRALEEGVVRIVADEFEIGLVPPPVAAVLVAASKVC